MNAQREKAIRLRELHQGPQILVLPNAWDVASARIFEEVGFPAIATTSAGIANLMGYPDGQYISCKEMLEMVARIAQTVSVPVTADMEAGYGDTPEQLADMACELITTGAVGLNLEDALHENDLFDVERQVEKIRAIRAVGDSAGVPLVINARTDVYLAREWDPAGRFAEAVRRLNAYRQAGADCLFAPGVRDLETIARLVKAVDGPLNILATAGTPSIGQLEAVGVARVSVGSGPARACMALVQHIAQELKDKGTYRSFTDQMMTYAEANRLIRAA
jgi:2-methylisocitrate lyase-like PEP mutase family enzyme